MFVDELWLLLIVVYVVLLHYGPKLGRAMDLWVIARADRAAARADKDRAASAAVEHHDA